MEKIDWDFVLHKFITIGSPLIITAYALRWIYGFLKNSFINNDFVCFYNAALLAASGSARTVYDFNVFQAILEMAARHQVAEAFFYPPSFMLILLPLTLLPYTISFFVWMAVTFSCCCYVVYRIAPHAASPWTFTAFCPALINVGYGQNGFLSAAIMGGGLLLVESHPYTGGLLLGLLTYKPNIAFLVLIALIAGRKWRAFSTFVVSTGLLILMSGLVFDFGVWRDYFDNIHRAVKMLETGLQGQIQDLSQMSSPYASVRLAGGGIQAARFVQIAAMLFALAVTAWVWFKPKPFSVRASILALCTMLFTPHLHTYDMTLLALAIAWIGWEGYSKGWLKGEKVFLFALWFSPLISLLSVKLIHFQIMPVVLVLFVAFILNQNHRPNSTE